jgi:hypothetical protein
MIFFGSFPLNVRVIQRQLFNGMDFADVVCQSSSRKKRDSSPTKGAEGPVSLHEGGGFSRFPELSDSEMWRRVLRD